MDSEREIGRYTLPRQTERTEVRKIEKLTTPRMAGKEYEDRKGKRWKNRGISKIL